MDDRRQVLNQWKRLWSSEFTARRVSVGQEAFKKLFEKAPETKALFKNVNVDDVESPEFRAHVVRVVNGLDAIINLSFSPDSLNQQLQHLAKQHVHYDGINAGHFDKFREALLETFPQAVPCFNSAAWKSCLKATQDVIASNV
jgi:hemoglobin-like flavoprotein